MPGPGRMSAKRSRPPLIARTIYRFPLLVILAWVALALLVTLAVPSLEHVGQEHSVSVSPKGAPSVRAMMRMGQDFKESDSDSSAMIVLESHQPLGDDAHDYYAGLIRQLRADPKHVQHVQDLWGDRLTAAAAQSPDEKAAYAQLNLAGNQGTTLGDESLAAVRSIVGRTPPPAGVKIYVTGAAPLIMDMQHSANDSILKITLVAAAIILTMLLLVYRSITTVILLLLTVGIELAMARGVVAFIGHNGILVLSMYAINLLMSLAMSAGTDYGIFFFGRYQEARQAGDDPKTAYYTTYRGIAKVVLASGLTIAGAMFCLAFTRMPYFQTMGVPCAVGMLVTTAVALTLSPAVIAVGSHFGLFEPKRIIGVRRWRRIGTAIVRWPVPILATACALALLGLLTLPGYKTSYNGRLYIPQDVPANLGYAAADRHFPQSRMMPEVLMIESDHDMRNPADFLVLNRLAKKIFRVPGVSRVQGITRPEGTPIEHTSIPFLISMQSATQQQNTHYMRERMKDMRKQADDMQHMIDITKHMYVLMQRMYNTTHHTLIITKEMADVLDELRDQAANFEDFWRPIRSYFYWEKHCYDIPICWSLRSIFDTLDGIDDLADKLRGVIKDFEQVDAILPQLIATMPRTIEITQDIRTMMLTMNSTMGGIMGEMDESSQQTNAMGQAFDASKNDDSFYLPPEIFEQPDFKRAMSNFLSPDGKAARFIISQKGDPASAEAIGRIDKIKLAASEALKGTPLSNANIFITGAASTYKDWRDGSQYDLLIAGVGALCLIFIIMLIITRSFIAALVIVGTVALSLGASFGVSVLLWQYLLGMKLFWMVLPMSVIILLAVGSDYNLLLVSRFKEEIAAGIKTGIIRAMGGTGKVVTNAGLVFAFTMASMAVSDLRVIGQIGTTIGLGLMFDTLIVRSFMTPSIAAMLGRWFWWPQVVRPRPASYLLEPLAPRPVVRALLLSQQRASDGFPVQDGTAPPGSAAHDVDTQPLSLAGHGHRPQVRVPDRFADTHPRFGVGEPYARPHRRTEQP
jgi:putative drug exporter of the RND superfamily